jgi:hypothetical protein
MKLFLHKLFFKKDGDYTNFFIFKQLIVYYLKKGSTWVYLKTDYT